MADRRTVFFVSDRTGITAEMLGNSLLTQFEDIPFRRVTIPFVDSMEKVADAVRQVNATAAAEGRRPIVVSSVVDETMSETIRRDVEALTLDMFQIFIQPLEAELGAKSSHAAGRSHGIANSHEYFARMEAINFTQAYDDGAATRDLDKAQVILVGVSRCGKTPTSLYLALQFGIRAANFPLTPDDFADRRLPASVLPFRERLFGLTIQPERLREIRATGKLPPRGARSGAPDASARDSHARHDVEIDRGNRDDDPASREARATYLLAARRVDAAASPHADGRLPVRCRTLSNSTTAAAAAALSDSLPVAIGIVIR
jgi:regulator of PEP synthase PpsR (kinase-PPPase family)